MGIRFLQLVFAWTVAVSVCLAESAMVTKKFRGIRPDDLQGRQGLPNPERGFRTEMYAGCLPGEQWMCKVVTMGPKSPRFRHMDWQNQLDELQYDGVRIVQCYIYLHDYCHSPISSEKLADIERVLNEFRKYGAKALLRFAYATDMSKTTGPDRQTLLGHLKTLKPLLRKHADVIYVLQAGFIGAWGEWHSAYQDLDQDRDFTAQLLYGILDALPTNRMTMVRIPKYKREALMRPPFKGFGLLTEKNAFDGSPAARIGYHNDGFLAGHNCGYTFTEPPYSNPGNRDFDQMSAESIYLPVDGELFWGTRSSVEPVGALRAITRMRDHHYTTFSLVHSWSRFEQQPYSIDFWRTLMVDLWALKDRKLPISDGYFQDAEGGVVKRTAYEYIRDHLGYRFELRQATFPARIARGETFDLSFSLVNRGFGTLVNPRPVFLTLVDAGGQRFDFPIPTDPRRWFPAERGKLPPVHKVSFSLPLPGTLASGTCRLGLWLPDEAATLRDRSDYAIRLANGDVTFFADSERKGGINFFGKCTIEK